MRQKKLDANAVLYRGGATASKFAIVSIRKRWCGTRKPHIKVVSGVWCCTEFAQFSREAELFCLVRNIERLGGSRA